MPSINTDSIVSIRSNIKEISKFLQDFRKGLMKTNQVMGSIGEALKISTRERFLQEISPSGEKWAPNSQFTIQRYLQRKGNAFKKKKKDGQRVLNKRGQKLVANKKILVDSGTMKRDIVYNVFPFGLRFGAGFESAKYSAKMQFGGTTNLPSGKIAIIPARPFIGISIQDNEMIKEKMKLYLSNEWNLNASKIKKFNQK